MPCKAQENSNKQTLLQCLLCARNRYKGWVKKLYSKHLFYLLLFCSPTQLIRATSPIRFQGPKEMLPQPEQTQVNQDTTINFATDPFKKKGLRWVDVLPLFTRFVSLLRKQHPGS